MSASAMRAEETKHLPPPPPESVKEFVKSAEQLDYKAAVVLGVVEGLTEYLPVSSTGHLILANNFLGLERDVAVVGKDGEQIFTMEKAPLPTRVWDSVVGTQSQPPAEVPFTLKNAADAYVIVIQFGAILAVLFAYWKRVGGLVTGMLTGKRESWQLGSNLIVAFLPAAVIGLIFNKFIEQKLFGVWPVIFALFVGGWVMLWIEKRHRKMVAKGLEQGTELEKLSWKQALGIGIAQCCAMWPGTSRSMATICGGYSVGLSPAQATEFSFLLGLITLTAASGYKVVSTGKLMMKAFETGPAVLGMVVATITAFFAVKWMVGWISRNGLALFAWYRIGLAGVLFLYFWL